MHKDIPEGYFDVLIVGAGPAGTASAAVAAKKYGLRTCVIDKAVFPRDKICGDLIIQNSLSVFEQCGMDTSDIVNISTKCCRMSCSSMNKDSFTVDLQHAPVGGIVLKRELFDYNLLQKILPYVQPFLGYNIVSIDRKDGFYAITISDGNRVATTVYSKYIIGADGASSFVRRNFFRDFHLEYGIATREYCQVSLDKYECTIYYFPEIEYGGYFWIFPVNDTEVNCGVVLYTQQWKSKFKTMLEAHNYYKEKILGVVAVKKNINTWSLPINTSIQHVAKENVLLAGDAAGLIHPFLGHGIDTAIYSASIAIRHIVAHLANGQYDLDKMYSDEINEMFIVHNIRFKQYREIHMTVNNEFIPKLQHILFDVQEHYMSYLKAL